MLTMFYLKSPRAIVLIIAMMLLSLSLPTLLKADDCEVRKQQIFAASKAQDQTQLQIFNTQMQQSDCLAMDKSYAARQLAVLMYRQLAAQDLQGEAKRQGLEEIKTVYPHLWTVLMSLAEYYAEKKQFAATAQYYQKTLTVLLRED